MWLADSNILIRAASAIDHPLQAWLQDQLPAISVVTRIETLGFHRLRADEEIALRLLLSSFDEYPITCGLQQALFSIELRRQRKMSLGDALIAATCLDVPRPASPALRMYRRSCFHENMVLCKIVGDQLQF
jgi:toxin FitB